jgi:diguanylate cyclase (GGDEF)-like protein
MTHEMARPDTSVLGMLLAGTIAAGAFAGDRALEIAGCLWAVLMLGAMLPQLRRRAAPSHAHGLRILFMVAAGLWLIGDLFSVAGVGAHAGFPSVVDVFSAAGTVAFCVVIAWVGRIRGLWPDVSRQLDGLVFAVAVFAPLWFGVVAPQGAPADLVLWSITALALLGFGGTYILGGGLWNVPAALLALGVVVNVAVQLAARIDGSGVSAAFASFHGFGFVVWTFVARHPRLDDVFERGHRTEGIPLEARVWLLPPAVAMPIAVLGWAYVTGRPLPLTLVIGPLAVITVIIALRAVLEARSGRETWHVPLTISFTTLVAALAAVCLSLAGQETQRAFANATRLSATIPTVERLDAILLRATSAAGATDAPRARQAGSEWTATVARLRREIGRGHAPIDTLVDAYVARGASVLAGGPARKRQVDVIVGPAYERLVAGIRAGVADQRSAGRAGARHARLLTVAALFSALLAITLLLLRFSYAGRRAALSYQEGHDALTGLPNRSALEQRVRRGTRASGGEAQAQTLVWLDLDDFKAINDAQGHPAGDALLRAVAARLDALTRGNELLARVDGDSFAVLLEGDSREDEAARVAQRMTVALSEPFDVGGEAYVVQGSIGIAMGGTDGAPGPAGDDADLIVLRDAELAMYEAKRIPGNSIEYFAPSMHESARDRLALTADLRRALELDELHLVYQPIVDLESGTALGYEALVRWNHPERGALSPADFIPLAETTGLIVPLGGWVLREACRQMQEWQADWTERRYISVNVASQQLAAGIFPDQVRDALAASGLPAEQLLLEVTESSLIENIDAALHQMAEVRALGARFALDDFGTGYSSLSYLRQFRVDVVKVDKSFIDDVIDADGGSLVEAIVHMAASLRMKVVAEGIEADEQTDALRRLGCEVGQGFRFSRPLAAGDVLGSPAQFGLRPGAATALRVASPSQTRVA